MSSLYMSGKTAGLVAQSVRESSNDMEFTLEKEAAGFISKLETMSKNEQKMYILEDVDYLKDVVISMQKSIDEVGAEYCNIVSDILFEIETNYQAYYDLSEDDWSKVSA